MLGASPDSLKVVITPPDPLFQSSSEAVVTATTYLELCLRSVDHPELVRALVRLLLRHKHDGVLVIDTLVQRIAATPRVRRWGT